MITDGQFAKTLALAFCGLFLGVWSSAQAVDLTVRENVYELTPVSQLQHQGVMDYGIVSAADEGDGHMGVEAIRSLEYHPKTLASLEKPVSISPSKKAYDMPYQPVPAMVVFPVMVHSAQNKAFSDLPVVLSSSVASHMSAEFQKRDLDYQVMNPIYTYDELREKGLDGLYKKLIRDYLEAGLPHEGDLQYLAEQLSNKTRHVQWVAFVHADLDMNNLSKPAGFQIPMYSLVDIKPGDPNYFLSGKVKIFGVASNTPLLWEKTATSSIKMSAFGNYTKSVYDDSDSSFTFKSIADKLSKSIVSGIPKEKLATYTSVQANLAPDTIDTPSQITPADREAFERILNYKK